MGPSAQPLEVLRAPWSNRRMSAQPMVAAPATAGASDVSPRRFRKILIANRGEIACRVIRACRELGHRHGRRLLGRRPRSGARAHGRSRRWRWDRRRRARAIWPSTSCCTRSAPRGADAVHPGYGFLSENADFAEAVAGTGAVFIGPPAAAIRAMGGKTSARALMQAAGVPVVPGDNGADGQGFASRRGGQGGRGAHRLPGAAEGGRRRAAGGACVWSTAEDKLEAALAGARREAKASFADDAVYLEKAIVRPRHIEIQVFGDNHGNVVHLHERDCSIQRRNQKVIEEAPSPAIDDDLRARMGAGGGAGRAARWAMSAPAPSRCCSTAPRADFYFLEMNTRLQVEHPVTELITGVDLVRWQIAVAEGAAPAAGAGARSPGAAPPSSVASTPRTP